MTFIDGLALGIIVTMQVLGGYVRTRLDTVMEQFTDFVSHLPRQTEAQALYGQLELVRAACIQSWMLGGMTEDQAGAEYERRKKAALH